MYRLREPPASFRGVCNYIIASRSQPDLHSPIVRAARAAPKGPLHRRGRGHPLYPDCHITWRINQLLNGKRRRQVVWGGTPAFRTVWVDPASPWGRRVLQVVYLYDEFPFAVGIVTVDVGLVLFGFRAVGQLNISVRLLHAGAAVSLRAAQAAVRT